MQRAVTEMKCFDYLKNQICICERELKMRRLLIGIIAVVVVGMAVVLLPKNTEETGDGIQSK